MLRAQHLLGASQQFILSFTAAQALGDVADNQFLIIMGETARAEILSQPGDVFPTGWFTLRIVEKERRIELQLLADMLEETAWEHVKVMRESPCQPHATEQQSKADLIMFTTTLKNLLTALLRISEIPQQLSSGKVFWDRLKT